MGKSGGTNPDSDTLVGARVSINKSDTYSIKVLQYLLTSSCRPYMHLPISRNYSQARNITAWT